MKIEVTAYHISQGRSGEYNSCPVALALWEAGFRNINIDENMMKLTYGRRNLEIKTPKPIKSFISDFDNFRDVEPAEFNLSLG